MFCPLCVSELLDRSFRSGIEIEICPNCRGVWLDRGELDRLVEELDEPFEEDLEPGGFVTPTGNARQTKARPAPTPPPPTPPPSQYRSPPPPRIPPPPDIEDRSTPPPGWHEPQKPTKPRKKKKRKKKKGFEDKVEDLFDELFDFFD